MAFLEKFTNICDTLTQQECSGTNTVECVTQIIATRNIEWCLTTGAKLLANKSKINYTFDRT